MRMFVFEAASRRRVRPSLLVLLLPFCASFLLAQTGTNQPAANL